MIDDTQIYVVVDIEADGPAPGLNSMLSLAAVATTADKEIARFYRKILPLKDATTDPDTMGWWSSQPEAWREVNTDPEPPKTVMSDFYEWVQDLVLEPIFVANPIALDYTFVSWYLHRFAPKDPFRNEKNAIRTIDLRSFIVGKYDLPFNTASRVNLPVLLTAGMPEHTHKAIDDAVGYAVLVRKLLKTDSLAQSL